MNITMDKSLEDAIAQCEKVFGIGSVIYKDEPLSLKRVSTGSFKIDRITGGGLPRGRIIEVYGPEASGKTTFCIHHMVEHQKLGGIVLFIDTEHSFDIEYAKVLGLREYDDNGERIFLISQPKYGEEALQIAETMLKSSKISLCVVDSVAALTPKNEIEGEMGEQKMGLQARLMSQAMRKLTAIVQDTSSTLIFTNQLRHKIGVMYGSPEVTTGGNALKYYASIRLDIRSSTKITDKQNENVGNILRVKTVKNKTFPPFKSTETILYFGKGIDREREIIDLAVDLGIIQKSGSWYSHGDTRLGQGMDNLMSLLKDNEDFFEEIKNQVIENLNE